MYVHNRSGTSCQIRAQEVSSVVSGTCTIGQVRRARYVHKKSVQSCQGRAQEARLGQVFINVLLTLFRICYTKLRYTTLLLALNAPSR